MKPLILVPVDFTDNAFNAYIYANNLAYYLDCNLHLIHVASGQQIVEKDHSYEKLTAKLNSFSTWRPNEVSKRFYPVETTVEVLVGDIIKQIIARSNQDLFRFIVCATRDRHSATEKWLGTISSGIAQASNIPVILVPKSAEFSNLDTIVVGCDEYARDDYALTQISLLSDWFGSSLHFVHVEQKSDEAFRLVERDILESLVALQKKPLKVKMAAIGGVDIVSAIYQYASRTKADLLILISEKRNFLQKLLFQSMTKKAALDTLVPTMIMHI